MDDMLNVELVKQLRLKKGKPPVSWLIQHVGMARASGYLMFRKGLLPEDPEKRHEVLEKLATFLDVEVQQILLRPQSRRTA